MPSRNRPLAPSAPTDAISVDDPAVLTDAEMKAYLRRAHAVIAAALPHKTRRALGLESVVSALVAGPPAL